MKTRTSPPKAIATLEHDASELIASGMVTLNSKIVGAEEEDLVDRVVEVWKFFWDEVLPYVEGVSPAAKRQPYHGYMACTGTLGLAICSAASARTLSFVLSFRAPSHAICHG